MERYYVRVEGRVQGVGFRFFVQTHARRLHVTGWIFNCCDGSVEMEVQGESSDLERLFFEIERGNHFIRVENIWKIKKAVLEENDFRIKG